MNACTEGCIISNCDKSIISSGTLIPLMLWFGRISNDKISAHIKNRYGDSFAAYLLSHEAIQSNNQLQIYMT